MEDRILKKKNFKRARIIITLCVVPALVFHIVWMTVFNISSSHRITIIRAVEFADGILDGRVSADDTIIRREFSENIVRYLRDPISRREH